VAQSADSVIGALASLHTHPTDDSEAHFLCSGIFIAPGYILTVRHAFDGVPPSNVWVRPQANRSPAVPILGTAEFHPSLDAAVIRIESMPLGARAAELDCGAAFLAGQKYLLYGYFENRVQSALPRTVTAFDFQDRRYTVEPQHAAGMSGGGLWIKNALWGLVTERYLDLSANRGCVIALHQIWEGFLDRMPGTAARNPGRGNPATVVHELRHRLIEDFRTIVHELLRLSPLREWSYLQHEAAGSPVLRVLSSIDTRLFGEEALSCVIDLTDAINQAVLEGEMRLSPSQALPIRSRLFRSMGMAARLCLDPSQLESLKTMGQRIEVAASTREGGLIATRERPDVGWEPRQYDVDAPTVTDRFSAELGLESGEGEDARFGLASLIASMPSQINPTGRAVHLRDQIALRKWRAFLTDERSRGRGRYLVLGSAQRTALGQEMEAWLDWFGVSVLVLLGDEADLFWLEEDLLLGRIQGFVHSFENYRHWKVAPLS